MIGGERKSLQGEGDTRYETVAEERKRTHDKYDKDNIASKTHQTYMVMRGVSASSRVRMGLSSLRESMASSPRATPYVPLASQCPWSAMQECMTWYNCNRILGQMIGGRVGVWLGRIACAYQRDRALKISLLACTIFPTSSDSLEYRHAIRR